MLFKPTTYLKLFIVLFFFNACTPKEKPSDKTEWINFEWSGDSIGNRYFDKTAMYIPFNIKGISSNFIAQFDLGSNGTIFYENSFKAFLSKYPEIGKKLDTINSKITINNEQQGEFNNIEIYLDSFKINLEKVVYLKKFGEIISADSINSLTKKHIGTIGADVVKDKILIIDYPNKKIAILDSLTQDRKADYDFVNCRITNGRIKIPLTIDNVTQWYMFDTGASLFAIVTDENNWKNMCDESHLDSIEISSWGESYTMTGAKINKDVFLGKTKLSESEAYKMPLDGYLEMFKQEEISGSTGNAYFLNNTIAIDFKNIKFGILKTEK